METFQSEKSYSMVISILLPNTCMKVELEQLIPPIAKTENVQDSNMKKGFTLIETLVVLVIIAVLAGIVFRLGSLAAMKADRTRGITEIELIKDALEAYYNKYGVYPPTLQIEWHEEFKLPPQYLIPDGLDLGYSTGLVWYLFYQPDLSRPEWYEQFLTDVNEKTDQTYEKSETVTMTLPSGGVITYSLIWTNKIIDFVDPWGNYYEYNVGSNEFQSYSIFGAGPDGIMNTVDDIGRQWNE